MARNFTRRFSSPHPQPNPFSVRYYHFVMWQEGGVVRNGTLGVNCLENLLGDVEVMARHHFQIPQDTLVLTERTY